MTNLNVSVSLLRRGDQAEFSRINEFLWRTYLPSVIEGASLCEADRKAVASTTLEVFLSATETRDKEIQAPDAYLCGIATHVAMQTYNRNARFERLKTCVAADARVSKQNAVSVSESGSEPLLRLRAKLSRADKASQRLVGDLLHFWESMPTLQMHGLRKAFALKMGLTEACVRQRLQRIRNAVLRREGGREPARLP